MNQIAPEQLAQMLGVPLFNTPYFIPVYPSGDQGSWRLSHMASGIDFGYYTRQWLISGMPLLMRHAPGNPEQWETWMSLTPHEIESQEPGCLCAHGHTVIMGLGMGWVALNAALNPAVRKVTVVELDEEVIKLISASGVTGQLPPEIADKIVIVRANAMEWQPDEPVDFLYADIWRPIADTNALADTQRMQQNIQATEVYFWGQELRLFTAHQRMFGPDAPLGVEGLRHCASRELSLPLVLPWGDEYPERITAAVTNRQVRGLPMEERA
ncbi:MAG: hypothetical protein A2076_03370 [Geobacteraceae bacterium GWC2_53_11]|nr:MAG: hypothetical protein A2076_03370 [Geobacteraceae bacterium GWC2_53_11]